MMAYRALGAITSAITRLKRNDPETAMYILRAALDRYEAVNHELQSLKYSARKKENRHVVTSNQSAA